MVKIQFEVDTVSVQRSHSRSGASRFPSQGPAWRRGQGTKPAM